MVAPNVTRQGYQLMDIVGNTTSLLHLDTMEERSDLELPNDDSEYDKMREDFAAGKELIVTVIAAMGQEKLLPQYTVGSSGE